MVKGNKIIVHARLNKKAIVMSKEIFEMIVQRRKLQNYIMLLKYPKQKYVKMLKVE